MYQKERCTMYQTERCTMYQKERFYKRLFDKLPNMLPHISFYVLTDCCLVIKETIDKLFGDGFRPLPGNSR